MTRRPKRYTPDRYGYPVTAKKAEQGIPVSHPRTTVDEWPRYLLKRIPAALRDSLAATAMEMDWSVADVIRDTLCQHYQLDCPLRSYTYSSALKPGTDTMTLRLQPELWREIKRDQKISERPIRSLIIEALEKRYAH